MKINYVKSIAAGLVLVAGAKAQVATLYTFSQQSGNYTAITGGTVFGTTSSDDQAFVDQSAPAGGFTYSGPGIDIGFNFMFNNTVYNRIGISNNGWIGFGHSSFSPAVDISNSGYTGISQTYGAPGIKQNRVAGLSRDLQAQTSPASSLRVQTIGAAPSRTCVIQFASYRKYGNTGDDISFQIRLLETTNIVQIVYGTFTNNATAGTAEVGLRGQSNADYSNRVTSSTNAWNASIAGTSNNAVVNYNNTGLVPASGQMYIWTPAQCSGSFSNLTAVAIPTMVCPNYGGTVSVLGTSTLSGITYTWYESNQSSVGNWTLVSGAESPFLNTPGLTTTHWYQAALTCINSAASATSSAAQILVAQTTTAGIPYYEGFENIPVDNVLPNCSWYAAGLGSSYQTYMTANNSNRVPRTGNKYAAYTAPTTTNFVYTNGIQLEPNVTYSAALYYQSDLSGSTNWTDLSILIGTAQTPATQTLIVSTSPAVTASYKLLSGTFQVGASGLYYMGMRATGGTAGAPYLVIDDISITIPCTPGSGNTPTVTAQGGSQTACLGQAFPVSAFGADVYQWSDNSVGSQAVVTPGSLGTNTFVVAGTNTLTGCTATAAVLVTVYAAPNVNVVASPPAVCQGKSVILTASGANNYNWSSGGNTSQIVVTPSSSENFIVVGTSTNGCASSASVSVTVLPLPAINASSTRSNICAGESTSIMGSGGDSYTWISSKSSNVLQGGTVTVSPGSSDTYTVTGTGSNGCQNTGMVSIAVDECLGIAGINAGTKLNVYPNPTSGGITIEGLTAQSLEVIDMTGRVLISRNTTGSVDHLDLSEFAHGVYYVKTGAAVIKIVRE